MHSTRKPLNPGVITAIIIAILVATGVIGGAHSAEPTERFTVQVDGSGPATLFIPGLTSSPAPFKSALTSPLPVQSHWITLAGFAGVPTPAEMDSFTAPAAQALAEYIKTNDIQNAQLVGHSMGGIVALMIAAEAPEKVDRILIIDSVPFLAGLLQPGTTPEIAGLRKTAMQTQFANMSHEQFYAMLKQGLPIQATSKASQDQVWADIEASDREAIALATAEIFTTDYRSLLPQVKARVTVLVPHNAFLGAAPEQVRARYAAQYNGLANVDIQIIEDSRHFIMLDQPQAFAAALDAFLEESR